MFLTFGADRGPGETAAALALLLEAPEPVGPQDSTRRGALRADCATPLPRGVESKEATEGEPQAGRAGGVASRTEMMVLDSEGAADAAWGLHGEEAAERARRHLVGCLAWSSLRQTALLVPSGMKGRQGQLPSNHCQMRRTLQTNP